MSIDADFAELKQHLRTIEDLHGAERALIWDQSTYLPPNGVQARGRQLALLSSLSHERMADPAIGRLLDSVTPWAEKQGADSDAAAIVRVTRRDHERARRVPPEFVRRLSEHSSESYDVWQRARPANDFAAVKPYLEKTVGLSRELAAFHPGYAHPFDALIDLAEDGMTVDAVRRLFTELRKGLVPLIEAIRNSPAPDDRCITAGNFPEEAQRAFAEKVIRAFGYDFSSGRQDKTAHPFMIKLGRGDVRITTRYRTNDLSEGLFSTMHEAGHALYEQNIAAALEGTPLFSGTTAGVHESQSRLWENLVGRSLPFWRRWYAELQGAFPELKSVELASFHRAVNKVEASLRRTDADEVTYNLHVMLRFDFELALLEGKLKVADLPEAWRARMKEDLGVAPSDDKDGAMQDVHWYGNVVGGQFQSYTLGNIMSAQFFGAARRDLSDLDAQLGAGEFGALRGWLTERVYKHGRKFTAPEIVERATGEALSIKPYLAYLNTKYGALYGLH